MIDWNWLSSCLYLCAFWIFSCSLYRRRELCVFMSTLYFLISFICYYKMIILQKQCAMCGFRHTESLYLCDLCPLLSVSDAQQTDGEVNVRHLTSGNWEVTKILAYDESLNVVWVSYRHVQLIYTSLYIYIYNKIDHHIIFLFKGLIWA